jgi:predicted kinase
VELGRIKEAQNASRIALASSFARVHPEWYETAKDISQKARRASPSVVAISGKEIQDEDRTNEETAGEQTILATDEQPGDPGNKLLLFRKRAFQSNEEPLYSHLEAKSNQLTLAQKRARLIDIAHNLAEADLDRLLEFASGLDYTPASARRPREINLEEKGTLEMLVSLWTSGDLNIEDQVAVMSALRDCDNQLRQKNIINSIISYMFRLTQERMEGEHFWRKRVEARLTPQED